ncbi:hypothetical protein D3C72_1794740 [compost metagenome]
MLRGPCCCQACKAVMCWPTAPSSGPAPAARRACGWNGPPPAALPRAPWCAAPTCCPIPTAPAASICRACPPGRTSSTAWCSMTWQAAIPAHLPCRGISARRSPARAQPRALSAWCGAAIRWAKATASTKAWVACASMTKCARPTPMSFCTVATPSTPTAPSPRPSPCPMAAPGRTW